MNCYAHKLHYPNWQYHRNHKLALMSGVSGKRQNSSSHWTSLTESFEKLVINRNYSAMKMATGTLYTEWPGFQLWLKCFHCIMPQVDILYNQLQHDNGNSSSTCSVVNAFLEAVMKRIDFILLPINKKKPFLKKGKMD